MKATLDKFDSGWCSLSLEMTPDEIDVLIASLAQLKTNSGHFHIRSDFSGQPSIGDIEISCYSGPISKDLFLDPTPVIRD